MIFSDICLNPAFFLFFTPPKLIFTLFLHSQYRDNPTQIHPECLLDAPRKLTKPDSVFPHPSTFAPSFERYRNQKFNKKQKGKTLWQKSLE